MARYRDLSHRPPSGAVSPVNPGSLPVHGLDTDCIPEALPLSAEPGWNQVAADWRLMIEHGDAFGVSTESGRLIASGLTVMYGGPFGWISMILVTQEFRRRGLATRLMRACMDALRGHALVPALDASPEGREVYLRLGFRDVYRTTRMFAPGGRAAVAGDVAGVAGTRGASAEDLPSMVAYDRAPYGADRSYMLEHLRGRLPDAAFVAERDGRIRGMVLARDGRACAQVGPLIADDTGTAVALLRRAFNAIPGPVCLDIADHHEPIRTWLDTLGFSPVVRFVRMIHERGEPYDDPERVFVIAGPELG